MKKVYMILCAMALFVLTMGIVSLTGDINFKSRAVLTDATVTGMMHNPFHSRGTTNYSYAPTVSYITRDGLNRTCETKSYHYPPAYTIGEKVKVFYDPAKPDVARLGNGLGKSIMLFIIGVVSCLTLIFLFVRSVIKGKARKQLTQTGMKIAADIVSVANNETPVVMGKRPYIIKCQWLQNSSNTIFHFKSKYIYYNPAKYIGERKQLDIFIDPNDPKKYFMDISFLPKKE
jgi:hypothetical protein